MNLFSRLVSLVGAVVVISVVACSSSDDNEVCRAGSQCVCKDSCSKSCESDTKGNCQFVCQAGSCSFDCAGGDCQVSCDGTASCNVACPKGGCRVTGGSGKTDVSCGGLGTCTVACSGPAESCLVDGKPATASGGGGGSGVDAGLGDLPGLPGAGE